MCGGVNMGALGPGTALLDGAVTSISSSPRHPNAFVSGGTDARLRFWDASTLKLVSAVEHAHVAAVHAVAAHPTDTNLVATCGEDGAGRVWDARAAGGGGGAGKPQMQRSGDDIRRNMGRAFAVEWCRDGASVAAGFESGDVCFLDVGGMTVYSRNTFFAQLKA